MIQIIARLLSLIPMAFKQRSDLALENLALRQQLVIFKRSHRRTKLRRSDRIFWFLLSQLCPNWKDVLVVVKPETVIRWHRKRFASYWTRLSRCNRSGRLRKDREIRELIRKMANANPTWGAPRIYGELQKLGITVSERSVSRMMPRIRKPPSQTWKTFLDNHVRDLVSIDSLTVPTATFRVLFVLIVLAHHRRRVIHFNVTDHPTAA